MAFSKTNNSALAYLISQVACALYIRATPYKLIKIKDFSMH